MSIPRSIWPHFEPERECRVQVTAGAALFYPLLFFLDTEGFFPVLLPGIVFHELGHLLALRAFGGRLLLLRLEAAGLYMDTTPFISRRQALFCIAAGPFAGLLWAALSLLSGTAWGVRSAAASLVINSFNLLPAIPLDGGEILYILTDSKTATQICSISVVCLLIAGFFVYRAWGLLVPAVLIARTMISS